MTGVISNFQPYNGISPNRRLLAGGQYVVASKELGLKGAQKRLTWAESDGSCA
ncbi:MAG: hypothetical protein IT324_25840 [Anaerolineae bacterium]|nr:hypothetical protein [Anaerolineae bacterium]